MHFELNEASASQAGEVAKRLVEFAEKYRKDEGTLDWCVAFLALLHLPPRARRASEKTPRN